mmetsp:Transcript_3682/g.6104  ORF Transcript_3682/g.6104 Transcript_3682/m.6104 type:complete len:514 (-) Transcript_3682:37-1578(-)
MSLKSQHQSGPTSSSFMSSRMLAASKIVIAIAALVYHYTYFREKKEPGACPDRFNFGDYALHRQNFVENQEIYLGECYFPSDYEEGRTRFIQAAQMAGASDIRSMPVMEGLTTDLAIFQGSDNYLVHISGTHGPEGYLGSAVQFAALQHLAHTGMYKQRQPQSRDQSANATTSLPTIIFIHALNPYGFKYHRRVNEDNVDLNRNFLSPAEREFVSNLQENYAGHITLQGAINPTWQPFSNPSITEIYNLVTAGYYVARYGMHKLKMAMVAGNYKNPKGYAYGGLDYTTSAKNLIDLLIRDLQLPTRADKLVLIDVHTGLGPSGVDTLLFREDEAEAEVAGGSTLDILEKIFPTEYAQNQQQHHQQHQQKQQENEEKEREESGINNSALELFRSAIGRVQSMVANSLGSSADKKPFGALKSSISITRSSSTSASSNTNNKNKSNKSNKSKNGGQSNVAVAVGKGYEQTKGVLSSTFCKDMVAPHLMGEDKICLTQIVSHSTGTSTNGERLYFDV